MAIGEKGQNYWLRLEWRIKVMYGRRFDKK